VRNPETSNLEELLDSLENVIQELRVALKGQKSPTYFIDPLTYHIENLSKFFVLTEANLELEHKRHIYANIARFVKEKIYSIDSNLNVYTQALCRLCGETEFQLVDEDKYDEQISKVFEAAKAVIMMIRISYEKTDRADTYNIRTEITTLMPENSNPRATRIEEEASWDNLPSDVRHSFFKEGSASESFQIYP
jgi:hypothetical protein